ncbi:DedA family protein [Streptomyces fragilis]|uniref:VTT domain-containing protein n=1 Tax=Streptomyces fragilis TaxID=67301 RepID=A0ABV2YBW2_9ACTN|nr:VTT domain-containing protein [Streptomyces fragilis]
MTPDGAVGYPMLFLLVLAGALVPVIPTGALVSSGAVVAFHHGAPGVTLGVELLVASTAAFLGDVALYSLGQRGMDSRGGTRWLERIRDRAPQERMEQAQDRLRRHAVAVLVLSRLIPGGRLPVILACLVAHWPLRRFVRGNAPACVVWAATYQVIGVLGGSLFDEPWKGVVAAVLLTLTISAAPAAWSHYRDR